MNCKPGDLAIVLFSGYGNEGKIVDVIKASQNYPGFWMCGVRGRKINSNLGEVEQAAFEDRYLKPVSGLPMEEETQETIKEKA